MSKLERLIAELCPEGIEFVRLRDVLTIKNGSDYKTFGSGTYPVYGTGGVMTYIDRYVYNKPSGLIPRKGSLDKLYYLEEPFWTVDTLYYTEIFETIAFPKYLYYYLQHLRLETLNVAGGVPSLTQNVLYDLLIPLPPLPVQREIVRILDNFEELTAELTARQKQYEYYRNGLLKFDKEETVLLTEKKKVKWLTLEDICIHISSGGTPLKSRADYYAGDIPWLRTQEVMFNEIWRTELTITQKALKNSSAKWIPENCVIVAISGATAARCAINKIRLTTNQHCCNLEIDKNIALYRYVFHWISSQYESLKALGQGARNDLNVGIISRYPIPIPSLSEQARIVSILDRFDALCNDLSSGLPAEIEARRKQYEYYREKLLTFKEKVS